METAYDPPVHLRPQVQGRIRAGQVTLSPATYHVALQLFGLCPRGWDQLMLCRSMALLCLPSVSVYLPMVQRTP